MQTRDDQDPKNPYRDCAGRSLVDYPRPSVAVDTALLTIMPAPSSGTGARTSPGKLAILQVQHRRRGRGSSEVWGLPGTFLHPGERLIDAVHRCLRDKAGVAGAVPTQLHVFDEPGRDDRGWVLSVAHLAVARYSSVAAAAAAPQVRFRPAADPGSMPYDHDAIVEQAVARLRATYAVRPDPYRLLCGRFTLRALRLVHEAVAGRPLQKDTFRRLMGPQLRPTGQLETGAIGKPAELFRRKR